ncbi:ABC transporter ATP-binding protein [Pseudomonas gingeri NCPPB 3146 = LMG 5327]|uniref:ABC-type dipeptide transporter n=2 Tax=Pseudomonas gingeri TaxID=117681 RepID=A0A7Y8CC50_9PSED|nr:MULTISPECIES: ABC transporter ATP-binding protein [Pseudomonas]NWC12597.1 ABC transporter ATP-binding protein [Pseudomonas gingeri]NWE50021.1 ABC transporter ATP-binding protein [Pseudomonas gingeri]NWE72102.1 ABC transporter ATP-binding protein [Pseudomonas gingeri]PNQ92229.1 ABC transporter ATP-binding protein [Pseudomonas gingeri NCPPB 3146 = LMG 5327]BBP77979.1 ABC transporter ATP-binding protein [Pseudomonas sp. Ost2]
MSNPPVLRIEGLSIELPPGADRSHAVQQIDLEVRKGEILCVIGESGSGKSVLSGAIMGDYAKGLRHSEGRIDFLGDDICRMDEARLRTLRGNRIAMIFQEPMAALNPAIRIGDQVQEIFEIHAPHMPLPERRERMLALLESTHLPEPPRIADSYPHQLSGGQCQRVVIAMALAMNPDLLIADEPTTALDVTTQAQVLKLIRELRGRGQHGILFITHDFGVVAEIADRIAVMEGGRLVEIGEREQVLQAPRHPYTRKLIAAVPALDPELHVPCADGEMALRIEHLNKTYNVDGRRVQALKDVSLQLPRGKTLAIVGESGSGKSTLVKAAIRLVDSDSGHVWLGDSDFLALKGAALTRGRRQIQMIFQDPYGSLNPRHRVGDIIARAAQLRGLSARDAWTEAGDLLEQVGLKRDALKRKPRQFSGGQRQRIGIARALAMRPQVLIADESVSALDVSVQKQVLELLAELQQRLNLSILFITHDLRVAAQISDHIAVMRQGEVVEYGTAEQVLLQPRHAYTQTLLAAAPGASVRPPPLAGPAPGLSVVNH